MKDITTLIKKTYKKYCNEDGPCYYGTCPIICLMINNQIHTQQENLFMLFGDFKLLQELAK